jgi:hypothetical protein
MMVKKYLVTPEMVPTASYIPPMFGEDGPPADIGWFDGLLSGAQQVEPEGELLGCPNIGPVGEAMGLQPYHCQGETLEAARRWDAVYPPPIGIIEPALEHRYDGHVPTYEEIIGGML